MSKCQSKYTFFLCVMFFTFLFIVYSAFDLNMDAYVLLDSSGKTLIILSVALLALKSSRMFTAISFPIITSMALMSLSPCIKFIITNSYEPYPRIELGISVSIIVLGYLFIFSAKRKVNHLSENDN